VGDIEKAVVGDDYDPGLRVVLECGCHQLSHHAVYSFERLIRLGAEDTALVL
jgi:hypothetical protein